MNSHEIPSSLKVRLVAEVRVRAHRRHSMNVMAWASSNEGSLPTLEEAMAEEWVASQTLVSALGQLALHSPEELFSPNLFHLPLEWD